MTPEQTERRSIIISIVASLSFGVLGVFISVFSNSGAVFLDGVFSLIFGVAGILTLYISQLVQRPRDEQYPFGYAQFEPMLNLFKGTLIALALLYAVWTAITTLITGGQEVAAVGGIAYCAVAVLGGVGVVIVLRRLNKTSRSPIVEVDTQNWTIDTAISAGVGIAFIATLIIQNSQWSDLAVYADPIIMLAIAAIAVPQPIQTIRKNWGQLMGRAPDRKLHARIAATVESVLQDVPHTEMHMRMTEVGRYLYIHMYVIVPRETDAPIDVRVQDRMRRRIYDRLSPEFRHLAIDVGFTTDVRWAQSSTPSEELETVYLAGELQRDQTLANSDQN